MMINACAKPPASGPFKLPKRVARMKRVAESRRMESLKNLQESLMKVGEKDKELLEEFTDKLKALWNDDDDENNIDIL